MRQLLAGMLLILAVMLALLSCGGGGSNGAPLSDAKSITAFSISNPAATGIIDETAMTISVTVPFGTDVTALIATFTTTGASVTVGNTLQVSGTTPNDFSNPVTYTVTAADGTSVTYIVTVTVASSSAKAIATFSFTNPAATGVIDETAKTISMTVPASANVKTLIATFTTTGASVTVGNTLQVSGTTSNDFSNPVTYTVTAADGTSVTYVVTVTVSPANVTHLAGPLVGAGNADGAGTAAGFYWPYGMTRDGTNLYVADTYNHTIRKIVITSGEVTTLAGTAGSAGSEDGTGAVARFYQPYGITSDGTNLYVADTGNHTIRKIVIASGEVTTLAGTAGSAGSTNGTGAVARFNYPFGITNDGTNLYVADTGNHTIRSIVLTSAAVTKLAGTVGTIGYSDGAGATARFNSPKGIIRNGADLYVADTYNHAIRKIVIMSGIVSTIAGLGSAGSTDGPGIDARFFYPSGITSDGINLYVADTSNNTIRQIVIASSVVSTLAGTALKIGSADDTGPAARFNYPAGITSDGTDIYVADTYNHTIRKIVIASGAVTTLSGPAEISVSTDGAGTTARFFYPSGITSDGTDIYVADTYNHTIRKIVIASGAVTTFAGTAGNAGSTNGTGPAARFNYPQGITSDGTNLYVADTSNSTIRQIVIASGEVTTLAGTAGSAGSDNGTGPAALFNYPAGITSDGAGNLYVADTGNNTIRKIVTASSVVTTLAGTAGSDGSTNGTGAVARFYRPYGITSNGTNLYVADTYNHTIRKIVIASGVVTTLAGTALSIGSMDGTGAAARFYRPYGLTSDGTSLYVAGTYNHTIRKIVIASGEVTTLAGSAGMGGSTDGTGATARFLQPYGITSLGTNLYVADTYNYAIRKISF